MNIKNLAEGFEKLKNRVKRYSSMQITDNREIIADGCLKIINCDESAVTLQLLKNTLFVTGSNLKMKSWGESGIIIRGEIASIEFGESANSGGNNGTR